MRARLLSATLMVTAAVVFAPAARAAYDAFIRFEDGSIPGTSKDPQHMGWIEISSFQIEQIRQAAASGGGAGKVHFHDIVITKKTDASTADLSRAAATGRRFHEVTLSMRKAGGDPGYLVVKLKNVAISGYQRSAGLPSESMSLSFEEISWQYTPQTPTRHPGGVAEAQLATGAVAAALAPPKITGASASAPFLGTTVTLTITSTGPCANAFVDYGDGSISEGHSLTGTTTQLTHAYAAAGARTIKVGGRDAPYWPKPAKPPQRGSNECTGGAPEVHVTLRSGAAPAPVVR